MIPLQLTLKRAALALMTATIAVGLFATGVWAGSTRDARDRPELEQARVSFWSYDPTTGNPTGPAGQPDFWNYDPTTGAQISDSTPGVAASELAMLWSGER